MKIAIAQLNPTIGDIVGNAQSILAAAHQASSQGAQLLLTPELSLCGYPPRDLLMHPDFIEAMAQALAQLAQQLPPQLRTLVGVVTLNPDAGKEGGKPLFNSTALLSDGAIQQIFHKRLLPTYDVFDEDRYFEPGLQPNHFSLTPSVHHLTPDLSNAQSPIPNSQSPIPLHIGVTICEDLWNDEEFWGKRNYDINPVADLAQVGVDFTINLSASPFSAGKQKVREAMLKHAATRFDQPLIYVNQVGGNDDLIFDGYSVVVNRQGEVICRARSFAVDLVFVNYSLDTQDLEPLPETTIAPLPDSEDAEIWSALVLGVRDYARKCGFSKAVIGLSGGIDSALVAAIATEALGQANVLGVLMPSPYSSAHSIKDALQLAENLGIQTQTLPIGELMQGYDRTLEKMFAGTEFGVAEENIQSRIRGNLLMAIANKFGYLLLSTGNKSEMAVGYCTLYGDMNGGLAAIADVPKTRVYSICQWLNSDSDSYSFCNLKSKIQNPKSEIIPYPILTKAPSAELKPGQVDQDSLPPYDILDDILVRLIHHHQTPDQIVAAGHDPEIVNKVTRLVIRAEFKRRQAPPVLKVTDRAFGVGWRMPIASHWVPTIHSPNIPTT
ncbi:NAD+ synthase [Leptodesmis sp.]|uniref:NAD+ synthase n=1 Tax=Leptodesmis sp. TaxID=3100501 RepID=UPI0040534A9A